MSQPANTRFWGFRGPIGRVAYLRNLGFAALGLAALLYYFFAVASEWHGGWSRTVNGICDLVFFFFLFATFGNFARRVQDIFRSQRFPFFKLALLTTGFAVLSYFSWYFTAAAMLWPTAHPGGLYKAKAKAPEAPEALGERAA